MGILQEKSTEDFVGQVVTDIAAANAGVMTTIGRRLGIFKAMMGAGALTPEELAAKTGLDARYLREWLNAMVASQYLDYAPDAGTYTLPDAYAPVLAVEGSPANVLPALECTAALWHDRGKLEAAFRSGEGIDWGDHHDTLYEGVEQLFRPGYKTSLVDEWIAALPGMTERLKAGGKVADVGCGHGASSVVIAEAFPETEVVGYDLHGPSIDVARERAAEAGVDDSCRFEVASATGYEDDDLDLICFMDCLHDMGDPVSAARHAHAALRDGGSLLVVEPAAGDRVEDNVHPVGRLFYTASTGLCVPCSLSQDVGLALGAQCGPARMADVLKEAGFAHVAVAAQTPFNNVIEARKAMQGLSERSVTAS